IPAQLWESSHSLERSLPAQHHHQTLEPNGKPAMWRESKFKSSKKTAHQFFTVTLGNAEVLEHPLLQFVILDPHIATAQFHAADDNVISCGAQDSQVIIILERQVPRIRCHHRMMMAAKPAGTVSIRHRHVRNKYADEATVMH